ncbi:MAG: leucine-rich repeat protein [Paludibacter sp.]
MLFIIVQETTLTLPGSVISIGDSAFYSCTGLTSLIIPGSVTYIGDRAFNNCNGLSSIYAYANQPVDITSSKYVFYNVNKATCTLYVPVGSKASYLSAPQWKDFTNIVEMTTGILTIDQSNIRIMNKDKTLIISNAKLGSKVKIYTVSGLTIKEQSIENNQTTITLPTGVYVLRIGDYSAKIVIK